MSPRRASREDDIRRIQLLLDDAVQAIEFTSGRARPDLDTDPLLQYALAKAIENVGHEADRLSDEARSLAPEIPWDRVIGMRHRLAHDYPSTDLDILWEVATVDVPEVRRVMRRVLDHLRHLGEESGGQDES